MVSVQNRDDPIDDRAHDSEDSGDEDYAPVQIDSGLRIPKSNTARKDDDDEDSDSEDEATTAQALADAGYDSGDDKVINGGGGNSEDDSDSSQAQKNRKGRSKSKKRKRGTDSRPNTDADDGIELEDGAGGLVKTRAQRQAEANLPLSSQTDKPARSEGGATDIDALWAAMNDPSKASLDSTLNPKTTQKASVPVRAGEDDDTITIERTYTFAGKVHHEKKTVPRDSREARAYLASLSTVPAPQSSTATTATQSEVPLSETASARPAGLRKVLRRKGVLSGGVRGGPGTSATPSTYVQVPLDGVGGGPAAKKINTLEKSRLEWAKFVDSQGIGDDLDRERQRGYLDKQDFLARSDATAAAAAATAAGRSRAR
ncbi:swr complex subunit [Savitreella phatthalungensis]